MKRIIQITALLLLAASLALAEDSESKIVRDGDSWLEVVTGTLSASSNLKLITDMGSVRIEGNSGLQEFRYEIRKRVRAASEQEARRQLEGIHISAGTSGDTAWIRGQAPKYSHRQYASADFIVQAPRDLQEVYARTGGGNLSVRAIHGEVKAETGGGGVQLDDIGGDIEAQSGGGNVEVGKAGGDVKIQTGGGSIHIRYVTGDLEAESGGGNIQIESGQKSVELQTGGGSITVDSSGGDLKASTGGSNIIIGNVNGKADLQTGGGSIRVSAANGMVEAQSGGGSIELYKMTHGAQVETGAGSIVAEFVGYGRNFGDSRLETAAGDISVYLPEDMPVTVDAAIDVSDGHNIHSEFSGLKIHSEGNDYGPKETSCYGKLNGGGATLHVHTTTGNIEFIKRTLAANDRNPH